MVQKNKYGFYILSLYCICAYGQGTDYYDSLKTFSRKSLKNRNLTIILDSVARNFYIDECCRSTLSHCLTRSPGCSIARRLNNYASWIILYKMRSPDTALIDLNRRYNSLCGPDTFQIRESFLATAGDRNAPVTLTLYMTASCPVCKSISIPLYRAVTRGSLAHIAKLRLKPISRLEDDFGLLASQRFNKFWELYLSLENEKRRLDRQLLLSYTDAIGLHRDSVIKLLGMETFGRILEENRLEAKNNGITLVPALFINHRRYESVLNTEWIGDAVECEYERIKK